MRFKTLAASALFCVILTGLQASERLKKEFDVGANPKFVLDADAANIEVVPGVENRIVAYVELPKRDRYTLTSSSENNEVRVNVKLKDKLVNWITYPFDVVASNQVKIRVEVPESLSLDVKSQAGRVEVRGIRGNILVGTSAGTIRLDSLAGNMTCYASGGSVSARVVEGSLDARTAAGDVDVYDSKGSFHLQTDAGTINVTASKGSFKLQSEVGSVDFSGTVTGGKDNYMTTSVGSIEVTLDGQRDIEIDAETDIGEVSISPEPKDLRKGEHYMIARIGEAPGAGSEEGKVGEEGKEGSVLRLRSHAGSIRVRKGSEEWTPVPEDTNTK
jgi:hypothetical protein